MEVGKTLWYSAAVKVDERAAEAVEFALNSTDALGTEISDLRKNADGTVNVVGYFDAPPDEAALRREIADAFRIYAFPESTAVSIRLGEIEDRDWLAEWKRHWTPQTVGRFVIAPPWSEVDASRRIVIRIEPNMAFGTGTHETTQLCLRAIEANYRPGMSLLDVGTGTGILAIAAAKLGSSITENTESTEETLGAAENHSAYSVPTVVNIFACDTDLDAMNIARENARLNGVDALIEFIDGPLPEDAPQFDIVCANLTLADILPILSLLHSKVRRTLILSGILVEQEDAIVSGLKRYPISDIEIEHAGEWIAVTCRL